MICKRTTAYETSQYSLSGLEAKGCKCMKQLSDKIRIKDFKHK